MTKKKEVIETRPIDKSVKVCQNCKWQNNNQSYCRKHAMPVGRKSTCINFK